jgi:alkanesulfonate monooxygenase SsuD/methylene tetrahydromethanopterin reductase-like flavin-dependent oxidoreductase (luciferase family)
MQSLDPKRSFHHRIKRAIEQIQLLEEQGFHSVWLGEHHFSEYSPLSRPLQIAAFLSAHTNKIRIGTAVALTPLYHPLTLAEEFNTLDQLSQGRTEIGLGRGYDNFIFDRFLQKNEDIESKWLEQINILILALVGNEFEFHGKYYDFPKTIITPTSFKSKKIPIWIATHSLKTITPFLDESINILTRGICDQNKSGLLAKELSDLRNKNLRDKISNIGAQVIVYIAKNDIDASDAIKLAKKSMYHTLSIRKNSIGNTASQSEIDALVEKNLIENSIIGTSKECIDKIRRLQKEVGLTHLIVNFDFGDIGKNRTLDSINRFANEVYPAFNGQSIST